MDLVLWVIFLWLIPNVVLGVFLFLAVWFSERFGKSKPTQLIPNDAKLHETEAKPGSLSTP